MSLEPSLWLLGLTLGVVGPILVRGHVRRAQQVTLQRTTRFLASAQALEAAQSEGQGTEIGAFTELPEPHVRTGEGR